MTTLTASPETTDRLLTDYEKDQLDQNLERLEVIRAFMLDHPLIGANAWVSNLYVSTSDKDTFQEYLDELGPFEKQSNSYNVTARRQLPSDSGKHRHVVEVSIDHAAFCEKVEVGTETVTEHVVPEGVEMVEVTKEVPVYEWVCPDSWKKA